MTGNSTPAKRLRVAAAATAMAAVAACSSGQSPSTSSPVQTDGTSAAPAPTTSSAHSSAHSPAQSSAQASADSNAGLLAAADTARNSVPGSTVSSIETENDDTRWKVQVVTTDGVEHEVEVAADGTKVLSGPVTKPEDAKDTAKHRSRIQAAKLDVRAAIDAVTKAVDGRVTELNLDDHEGTTVWEADVVDPANAKHDVSIDAATGAVVAQN